MNRERHSNVQERTWEHFPSLIIWSSSTPEWLKFLWSTLSVNYPKLMRGSSRWQKLFFCRKLRPQTSAFAQKRLSAIKSMLWIFSDISWGCECKTQGDASVFITLNNTVVAHHPPLLARLAACNFFLPPQIKFGLWVMVVNQSLRSTVKLQMCDSGADDNQVMKLLPKSYCFFLLHALSAHAQQTYFLIKQK